MTRTVIFVEGPDDREVIAHHLRHAGWGELESPDTWGTLRSFDQQIPNTLCTAQETLRRGNPTCYHRAGNQVALVPCRGHAEAAREAGATVGARLGIELERVLLVLDANGSATVRLAEAHEFLREEYPDDPLLHTVPVHGMSRQDARGDFAVFLWPGTGTTGRLEDVLLEALEALNPGMIANARAWVAGVRTANGSPLDATPAAKAIVSAVGATYGDVAGSNAVRIRRMPLLSTGLSGHAATFDQFLTAFLA